MFIARVDTFKFGVFGLWDGFPEIPKMLINEGSKKKREKKKKHKWEKKNAVCFLR